MASKQSRSSRLPEAQNGAADAARIEITGLTKRYLTPKGETFTAIRDVALTIEPGQFCAIVGPGTVH